MVTGEDCSCIDTTELSNVTSVHSDDVTSAVNSDAKLDLKTINGRSDVPEKSKDVDRKYSPDVSSVVSYCVAATTEAVLKKSDRQLRDDSKSQPPIRTPTSFQPTSPCFCHIHKINGYILPVKLKEENQQSRQFWSRFKWKKPKNVCCGKENKMYEIKLQQTQCSNYAKVRVNGSRKQHFDASSIFQPFVRCDMSDGIPSKNKKSHDSAGKSKQSKYEVKANTTREEAAEKIEIYYFDHGNSAYYRTTDCHPVLITDKCAEKTDQAATRFWAEIFGTIHIGIAFVTAFILQLLRFLLCSVFRPLTVGILQLIADYFIKPLLSIVFNALVQPILILFYNIATSLRDLCEPIAEAIGLFLREIANVCAAIRFVEVKHVHASTTTST